MASSWAAAQEATTRRGEGEAAGERELCVWVRGGESKAEVGLSWA